MRQVSQLIVFASLVAALPGLAVSQVSQSCHVDEMRDQVSPERLPGPQKLTHIGNASLKITANREAQAWFNQGLNLLHDFWDYESARAFQQGIRADARCAMCYWGLYQALSNYHSTSGDYAAAALAKAQERLQRVSRAERLYIEATVAQDQASRSMRRFDPDTARLWRELVRQYPHDTQAKIFLANAIQDGFDANGAPRPGQREALALFGEVIRVDPHNSAAHHYLVHSLEAVHPEQAVASAQVLASLAPASGHIVHMPGHIYYRLGDYARAEQSFMSSLEVDERYMREQSVSANDNWNYVHNLMYAIANLLEEGKMRQAEQLSEKIPVARGDLPSTMYTFSARDSISRIDPKLPVALRVADWAKALQLANASPDPAQPNLRFLKQSLIAFAEGMQAVGQGDVAAAEESFQEFDTLLKEANKRVNAAMPPPSAARPAVPRIQVMPDAVLPTLVSYLSVMSLELHGSVLLLKGQPEEGRTLFTQAAELEKGQGYREPPQYIRPVGEAQAAALLAANDWANARVAYQAALAERPRSGFPLFGIAMTHEHAGDVPAAVAAYTEFMQAWKDADAGLPQLVHAQAYLTEHRG